MLGRVVSNFIMQALTGKPLTVSSTACSIDLVSACFTLAYVYMGRPETGWLRYVARIGANNSDTSVLSSLTADVIK